MLYQLFQNQFKIIGAIGQRQIVQINGPHDKYGYILSYSAERKVYQIRGTGKTKPVGL